MEQELAENEYYITFLYKGTFIIQDWETYQSLATLYNVPTFSELAQVLKLGNANRCQTCLDTIWKYIPEDIQELIRNDIIQISFVLFTLNMPARIPCSIRYNLQYYIWVLLARHDIGRFDFYYAKSIEPLSSETREKMLKSIVYGLGQAVVQWEYNVLTKLGQLEQQGGYHV